MTAWTRTEITQLRHCRRMSMTMKHICRIFHARHDRDEVVEAIDATIRFPHDGAAMQHVNAVLSYIAGGVPLVNGRPADTRRAPMF